MHYGGLPLSSAVRLASPSRLGNCPGEATPRFGGEPPESFKDACPVSQRLTALESGKPQVAGCANEIVKWRNTISAHHLTW
jgi:hypothetical protein